MSTQVILRTSFGSIIIMSLLYLNWSFRDDFDLSQKSTHEFDRMLWCGAIVVFMSLAKRAVCGARSSWTWQRNFSLLSSVSMFVMILLLLPSRIVRVASCGQMETESCIWHHRVIEASGLWITRTWPMAIADHTHMSGELNTRWCECFSLSHPSLYAHPSHYKFMRRSLREENTYFNSAIYVTTKIVLNSLF